MRIPSTDLESERRGDEPAPVHRPRQSRASLAAGEDMRVVDTGVWASFLVLLAVVLAPILENLCFADACSRFLRVSKVGNAVAVAVTAVVFALCHGPMDLVHWISFGLTGIVYGSIRVISGTTPALRYRTRPII
jgi:membrane protease YdiL (CAAX protease family)